MPFFLSVVLFVGLALALAGAGMKMYVRPREAMERVAGGVQSPDQAPAHPSLAMHDLIKRLGNFVPQSPKDVTVMQRRLIRAGIRRESALKILYGAKVATGIIFPVLALSFLASSTMDSGNKISVILAAAAVGLFG